MEDACERKPGNSSSGHIAVMDSGVGGLSVLAALVAALPHERFQYFGDSANTPYGEKTTQWVLERTRKIVASQISAGAKAVVIACNTATSVAANSLRREFLNVPIVGIEPALKPAARALPGCRILVMATPMTLHLDKYQQLADEWGEGCTVIPVACDGLAGAIERSGPQSGEVRQLLKRILGSYRGMVKGVVLGCTHYPFVSNEIREVLGDVELFDGSQGTARQLKRLLEQHGLLSKSGSCGSVELFTSSTDACAMDMYRKLFEYASETIPVEI